MIMQELLKTVKFGYCVVDFFNDMNTKKPESTDIQKNQKKTISFAEAKERYGNLKVLGM